MKLTVTERFAFVGLMGMFLTGPWSFQHDFAWTVSALMTVPYVLVFAITMCRQALKGGGE